MLNLGGPGWFRDVFEVKVELRSDRQTDDTAQLGGKFPVHRVPLATLTAPLTATHPL